MLQKPPNFYEARVEGRLNNGALLKGGTEQCVRVNQVPNEITPSLGHLLSSPQL